MTCGKYDIKEVGGHSIHFCGDCVQENMKRLPYGIFVHDKNTEPCLSCMKGECKWKGG